MRIPSSLAYPIIGFIALSVFCTATSLYIWENRVMTENLRSSDRLRAERHHAFISQYVRNGTRTMQGLARVYSSYGPVVEELGRFFDQGGFNARADHLPLNRLLASLGIWDHMDDILITDLTGRIIARAKQGPRKKVLSGWGIAEAIRSRELILTTRSDTGWQIRALSTLFLDEEPIGIIVVIKKLNNAFAKKLSHRFDCQMALGKPEGIVATALPEGDRATEDRELVLEVLRHKKIERKDHKSLLRTEHYAQLMIVDEAFCLIVAQDTSHSHTLVRKNQKATLGLSILILGVISCLGLAFALKLIRPLRRLKLRSLHMAREYANVEQTEIPGNEVVSLVHGFDAMAEAIQQHIQDRKAMAAELENHRDRLEEVVAHRTERLNRVNKMLKVEIRDRIQAEKVLIKNEASLKTALSELKLAQAKMVQSEKMASVGQLAAGVAHEINNPTGFVKSNISSLSGYFKNIKVLLTSYGDLLASIRRRMAEAPCLEEFSDAVEQISNLADQAGLDYLMTDIPDLIQECQEGLERVQDIVAALRQHAHPGRSGTAPADINDCIDFSLKMVRNELKHKARVTKEYGDLPEVACNIPQISRVFVNILMNAAQAIDTKGEIRIITEPAWDGVMIRISDTGKGISKENLGRIFDPFFSTKEVGQGTGLGLHIVWDIIQIHGGQIDVESIEGKGTTFSLYLPQAGGPQPS